MKYAKPDKTPTKARYNERRLAYCKYCYQTHNKWVLGDDYGNDIVWVCLMCGYATHDNYMQIEGVKPSKQQWTFYEEQIPERVRRSVRYRVSSILSRLIQH